MNVIIVLVPVFKWKLLEWFTHSTLNKRRTTMRGNQEAFILVKIKDGRQYVCALNRLKSAKSQGDYQGKIDNTINLTKDVIWQ